MREPSGIIFDTDHFAVHDGPGVRTAVYFKGCPLRCAWCHSPESQNKEPELIHIKSNCRSCPECAMENCPRGAKKICGRAVSVSELSDELSRDKVFFDASGGGVTLTGGEALFQPEFAAALLEKLFAFGIHTVVETCAYCATGDLLALSPFTGIFYCDVKLIDDKKHKKHTGLGNGLILSNIASLAEKRERRGVVLRVPLIPGYTDSAEDVKKIYDFAMETGLTEIHLLPYNASAPAKYEWLSRSFPPGELGPREISYYGALAASAPEKLNVTIIN